jgi:hypothetical protein
MSEQPIGQRRVTNCLQSRKLCDCYNTIKTTPASIEELARMILIFDQENMNVQEGASSVVRAAKLISGIALGTNGLRLLPIAGEIIVIIALFVSLPYLLYWILWLFTGRGLPPKTLKEVEHARKLRRAEKIWALQAVCIMAVAVLIYIATMTLWRCHHSSSY